MTGQVIGYKRVSSTSQNTERQELPGCDVIFEDYISGASKDRPQLEAMMKHARAGDTVQVYSIDRLARSLIDLQEIVDQLVEKGVQVKFLKPGLEFSKDKENASGRLMLQVLGSIAEFERTLIRNRQREGIERAKDQGKFHGRKRSVNYDWIVALWEANKSRSLKMIAKHADTSVTTVHRALSKHQPYLDREEEIRNLTPHERTKLSVGGRQNTTLKPSDIYTPEQMYAMSLEELDAAIEKIEERAESAWNEEDQELLEGHAGSLKLIRQNKAAGY